MKPQANRTQSWLILAAMGGLVVAYAYFFHFPANREIAALKSRLAEAEQQAEGTVPLIAAIDATQKQLDAAVAYTQAWEEAAPSEYELAEVFERIHNLMRLAETETTRFEPQRAVPYETFLRIPVFMECRGSFAQLAAVLTGLEHMRETVWLRNVEIKSTGQDSEIARAEINLDIFADNLEDSDQENLSGKPITQEAGPSSAQVERSGTDS
jgi:Tfp pilus assembly protein PilO